MTMTKNKYIKIQDKVHMIGWNFEQLSGDIGEESLPWDYISIVKENLNKEDMFLDMETGGGEILKEIFLDPNKTYVTEGYEPNYLLCLEKLLPLGIKVFNINGEDSMPFSSNTFDLVTNRHGSYNLKEIYRVLKPGGLFITQQVGSNNNLPLREAVLSTKVKDKEHTIDKLIQESSEGGFYLLYQNHASPKMKYKTMFSVIFMASIISWEFPNFAVENNYNSLNRVEEIIKENGYFESYENRFIAIMQK